MKKLQLLIVLFSFSCALYAQLTIQIISIPNNTPVNSTLFLASNINNWETDNQNYAFNNLNNETYELNISASPGEIEFKITRGDWDNVEGNANGQYRPNRVYMYNGQLDTLKISVLSWEDLDGGPNNSTAADNVSILAEDFDLSTIGQKRRIWLYLPPDYDQTSKSYPVLYMQDGQNLFDANTSFSGEWRVDETLNDLFAQGDPGIIVVGIDNGGAGRINEYTPWPNPQYGGGQAAQYVLSIIQDLKPHIDANYRTLSDPKNTGIMGSSLGGLVSLYGLIEHQEVFGKAGVFSPSYWFSEEIYNYVSNTEKEQELRIYSIGGEQEGSNMATNLRRMDNTFSSAGFQSNEYKTIIHPDGQHTESYWAREFGEAYLWLFSNTTTTSIAQIENTLSLDIYPNPAQDSFQFNIQELPRKARVKIIDVNGRVWLKSKLRTKNQTFAIQHIPMGIYQVQLLSGKKLISTNRVVIK